MKRAILIIAALVLIAAGGYLGMNYLGAEPTVAQETAPTPLPPVLASDSVIAEAAVVPIKSAQLRFETAGTVSELLVREGDEVRAGQALARIDSRDLALAVEEARAQLAKAQAAYDKLAADATPEEIAEAEAAVTRSQAQLNEVVSSVTEADIAAARANLEQAQAELNELLAGPEQTELAEAQARVDQARARYDKAVVALQQTRDDASKAKTDAERAVETATLDLQVAQSEYSEAYWRYQNVQDKGRAPSNVEGQDNPEASDFGNLQEQESFKQAEIKLQNAQLKLEQAQKDLEKARQDEPTKIADAEQDIADAEAQIREAQANLDDLLEGADGDEIARARADVADAQARLDELLGEERNAGIAAAEANVAQSQAQLEQLTAPKRTVDLGEAQVDIQQAEVNLKKAELALDKATLVAPIDGTIAALDVEIGELADTTATVITMADLSELEIETDDLTELQVVDVNPGDKVTITFDALPGVELSGTVTRIKTLGENKQGDITYTVTVKPDQQDARLRWNMTAVVAIDPGE
jgi:HlyD family secretion protein